MQHYDAAYFATVVCLPLLVRLLMVPRIGEPVRAAGERVAERLWTQLVERGEPDELVLQRWAQTRRSLLEAHLARVRRLVLTDDAMSATRQVGNRLACARLESDVAEAVIAAPERLAEPTAEQASVAWSPTAAAVRYLPRPRLLGVGSVEVMEFGPSRRAR